MIVCPFCKHAYTRETYAAAPTADSAFSIYCKCGSTLDLQYIAGSTYIFHVATVHKNNQAVRGPDLYAWHIARQDALP